MAPRRSALQRRPRTLATVRAWRAGDRLYLIDQFVPTAKGAAFFRACHDSRYDEILFHGSIRGSKTQSASKMLVQWAMSYPGTYGIFRSTKQELEDSTKKILLYGDGVMPPAIPTELIAEINETYNRVVLVNGAELLFRSLEPKERGKIRNITFAGMFIDQIEELEDDADEDYYDELLGRISDPDPRSPGKMLAIANPGPETHWVCRRFGCTPDTERFKHPKTKAIHVSILDNQHNLNPDYVERLLGYRETRPDYYARMVMGQWGAFGGKRFKNWDRRKHVCARGDYPDTWDDGFTVYEGIDWGYDHPTAALSVVLDYEGRLWVAAEHFARRETVKTHAEAIKAQRLNQDMPVGGQLNPSATWLDPAAWNQQRKEISSIADSFREHGIYAAKAQNERVGGWNMIEELLDDVMDDGYSRLRILPWCENLIRELPNLRIKEGTDDVEKQHDDAADACRYVVKSRPVTPIEKARTPQEEHTRSAVSRRIVDRAQDHQRGRRVLQIGG